MTLSWGDAIAVADAGLLRMEAKRAELADREQRESGQATELTEEQHRAMVAQLVEQRQEFIEWLTAQPEENRVVNLADLGVDTSTRPDGCRCDVDLTAELDRLRAERDAAFADVGRMRLVLAMHGVGTDPDGFYAGTPGSRLRQLESDAAELDRARPVLDAAIALVADWSAHRATHGGDLWAAVDIYTGVEPAMTQNEPRVCEGCGQTQPERQPDSDPIPPQPEGDYFVIDLPEKLFLGSYVVQHAGGWGWQFAGGNKGGSAYTWDELAKRFKFGQPGGATITRLVRETAMPVNSNGDDDHV